MKAELYNRISPEIQRVLAEKLFWGQDCPSLDHELNLQKVFTEIQNKNLCIHLILFLLIITEHFFILLNEAPRPIAISCHLRESTLKQITKVSLCHSTATVWMNFKIWCHCNNGWRHYRVLLHELVCLIIMIKWYDVTDTDIYIYSTGWFLTIYIRNWHVTGLFLDYWGSLRH